jgi:hypothetical protein
MYTLRVEGIKCPRVGKNSLSVENEDKNERTIPDKSITYIGSEMLCQAIKTDDCNYDSTRKFFLGKTVQQSSQINFQFFAAFFPRKKLELGRGGVNCVKTSFSVLAQGCQMVYFQTKNPSMGKFWRALEWKSLVYSIYI